MRLLNDIKRSLSNKRGDVSYLQTTLILVVYVVIAALIVSAFIYIIENPVENTVKKQFDTANVSEEASFTDNDFSTEEQTSITYNLIGVSTQNTTLYAIKGSSYSTRLFSIKDYEDIDSVIITMNGEDITASSYDSNLKLVYIEDIAGNIVISATSIN